MLFRRATIVSFGLAVAGVVVACGGSPPGAKPATEPQSAGK